MTVLRVPAIRLIGLASGLLAVLALGACSAQRLAYNNADWLLLQKLDGYLDLDDAQETRAAEALAAALTQHRRGLLPEFATAFSRASDHVRRGFSEDDTRAFIDRAQTLLAASLEGVLPVVSGSLARLSAQQREHLAQRLVERNEDYAERNWLTAAREERLHRRAERTVSRIEDWTGPLEPEQVALVHRLRDAMPDNAAAWLDHSRAKQQALLTLLDNGAPVQEIEALLRGWWLFRDELHGPLAGAREAQTAAIVTLITELGATLDSVQRQHLASRLEDLARDARELALET